MTYKDFIERVEDYYGKYPSSPNICKYVLAYLKKDIDERKLQTLFRYVTYTHAHRFGPPGIAEIEKSIFECIKNKKGSDCHIISWGEVEAVTISDEDKRASDALMEQHGGLQGIFKSVLKSKNVKVG